METGKTGKYFKYAIGEIVLVVIGILIALSINTWNETNKSNKEAHFQLSKLKDNLTSDKEQLNAAILSDSIYINHLIFCVKVLSSEQNATYQEFIDGLQHLSTTMSFDPIRGTFDGLISSGKIELIRNQKLLEDLFSYYNPNTYKAWDNALKSYSRNVITPYLLNFDHVSNISDANFGENFTQFDISKFTVPTKTIDDYKNNLFIINGVRRKIQMFEGQTFAYKQLLIVIDSLIQSVDFELTK